VGLDCSRARLWNERLTICNSESGFRGKSFVREAEWGGTNASSELEN
jgi:hypothetical protein